MCHSIVERICLEEFRGQFAMKTHSEELFEEYLLGLGLQPDKDFEYEPVVPGKSKRVDFKLLRGPAVWFEVKELSEPEEKPTNGFSVCPAITKKVRRAREQFQEYQENACVLVLHSCESTFRLLSFHSVASTLFGEDFQVWPWLIGPIIDAPLRFKFRPGSATLNRKANTTISAVVILEHYEVNEFLVSIYHELAARQQGGEVITWQTQSHLLAQRQNEKIATTHPNTVRAVVLHNPYARIPLPVDLCAGPFDQQWASEDDEYSLTWLGQALQQLRQRPNPVPFLYL